MSWVHVDDVVRAILFAIDRESLLGPFNVVAPDPVSMNDFARALGAVMHRPSMFRVPPLALKAALGGGLAQVLLTGQRVTPTALLNAGFEFRFPRLDEALRDLLR
jgi:NAD dependent epimerase/dehydratase family enzyme